MLSRIADHPIKLTTPAVAGGHWKTTFVAGLRVTGRVAPMVLDGWINRAALRPMSNRSWCPTSARRNRDDGLVELSSKGPRQAIEAIGASLLYLPPDSPDFNSIENTFLRQAEGRSRKSASRTVDVAMWSTIGTLVDLFALQELREQLHRIRL